jgi:hypothetical protein
MEILMSEETALVETKKPTLTEIMAAEANLDRETYWSTVKKTAMPANTSDEHVAAFLVLAHDMGLNPLSDEAHAFPSKGGVKLMVGVDGWVSLANAQNNYDGWEHVDEFDDKGNLVSVTAVIRRRDHSAPTKITEYMDECKRNTDPWKQFPKRMLRHKAFSQGVRMAFGIKNAVDKDEARDMGYDADKREMVVINPEGEQADPLQLAAAQVNDQVKIGEPSFEDEMEKAKVEKVSKVVETKKGPVSVEIDGETPMDLVIKKINSYKTPGPLQSYVQLKKELEWPKQFSSDQIADLEELAEERLDVLREQFSKDLQKMADEQEVAE